jgi:cell division septum initiation protein DivIVA
MTDAPDSLEDYRDQLLDEVKDLRRQIDELRAFEREYRARLIAFCESQADSLRRPPQSPPGSSR